MALIDKFILYMQALDIFSQKFCGFLAINILLEIMSLLTPNTSR